jgi:small subunit ribosomal protein S6e
MAFKINIGKKDGKTFHLDIEMENLIGKKIGEDINGEELHSDLSGYTLKIKGLSDKAGFASLSDVEGSDLKKKLLKYGKGMKERYPHGMKKKKTIRGNTISNDTIQINVSVEKEGSKKLEEIFPEQCLPKEKKKWQAPEEVKVEGKKEEVKTEEVKKE